MVCQPIWATFFKNVAIGEQRRYTIFIGRNKPSLWKEVDFTVEQEQKIMMERLKRRRKELGYSYQDLANLTQMSKSTLQRYETGGIKNIPLSKLDVLSQALETSREWLMGWDEKKEASSASRQSDGFFRLKKGLEPYQLSEEDADFLIAVFEAHKQKNT